MNPEKLAPELPKTWGLGYPCTPVGDMKENPKSWQCD